MSEFENDVRLAPGGSSFRGPADGPDRRSEPDAPVRSRAQTRRDQILDDVEAELREARDLTERALEDLALVVQPQHPNLPTLLGQQLEQAIELRRLKR
jgi:hypothetical protein